MTIKKKKKKKNPSFPNNPNSISNKLSSISLDGKRKGQDIDIDVNKSVWMDTEGTVNAEEKKMQHSVDKFRIPVVLARLIKVEFLVQEMSTLLSILVVKSQ